MATTEKQERFPSRERVSTPNILTTDGGPRSTDLERQPHGYDDHSQFSAFKGLGVLDRFLALWIFLAITVGIILGNFAPRTGEVLQQGKFVGVSIPIGKATQMDQNMEDTG